MTTVNIETLVRLVFTYIIAMMILVGGWQALVINEFELNQLTQGAIIGFMGAAIQYVFGAQIAASTAASTVKALHTPVPPQPSEWTS